MWEMLLLWAFDQERVKSVSIRGKHKMWKCKPRFTEPHKESI
jgi:hypothetical protein